MSRRLRMVLAALFVSVALGVSACNAVTGPSGDCTQGQGSECPGG